jgi:glutamyl-tRNA reductase
MSGEAAARALRDKFDEIRRAELVRLRKKLSALTDEQRADVDMITGDIIHALARPPAEALAREGEPHLVGALVDLFKIGD